MAATGEAVSAAAGVESSGMQGGGGSTTVSDEHEQAVAEQQPNSNNINNANNNSNSNNKQAAGAGGGDLWPTCVVDSLIDQFEDIKVLKLNMGNLRSQHWGEIAASLNAAFNTSYDWKQCKNKVDLLIRLYKKAKVRMLHTETHPTWRFFDRMDSILGRTFKPSTAIASASNSKPSRNSAGNTNTTNNNNAAGDNNTTTNNTGKNSGSPLNNLDDEEDDDDEPPGHHPPRSGGTAGGEEDDEEQQQHTASSPRTSERADEIDYRTPLLRCSKKSKKSGRSSTSSAINLLVGALNHYTQAFERCKQLEVEAQLRMSQESRAFQLQIAEMQLEVTKEIVRVLGKRRRS